MSARSDSIAVTGANGFTGREILRTADNQGIPVRALTGDVREGSSFGEPFSTLLHLAGKRHAYFATDAETARTINIDGTRNAIEACRREDALLVFASTAGVYHPPQAMPVRETGQLGPISPYADSKLDCEEMIRVQCEAGNLRAVILRVFNPYGATQAPDQIFGYLLSELSAGRQPDIRAPEDARDFIHVCDVAEAFLAACGSREAFEIFNVGTGLPVKIGDLYRTVAGALGVDPIPLPSLKSAADNVYADITKFREQLGWRPQIMPEDGFRQAANLFLRQNAE